MSFKTSNYGAARGILGLFEILLWCGLAVGILIAISAGGAASRGFGASGLVAAIPGIFITITCFIGIVLVQMAKAGVDSADYSYQMLEIARKQLTISEQTLRQGKEMAQSFADRLPPSPTAPPVAQAEQQPSYGQRKAAAAEPASPSEQLAASDEVNVGTITHAGRKIEVRDGKYFVGSTGFVTEETARSYIDQLGVNPNVKLKAPSRA